MWIKTKRRVLPYGLTLLLTAGCNTSIKETSTESKITEPTPPFRLVPWEENSAVYYWLIPNKKELSRDSYKERVRNAQVVSAASDFCALDDLSNETLDNEQGDVRLPKIENIKGSRNAQTSQALIWMLHFWRTPRLAFRSLLSLERAVLLRAYDEQIAPVYAFLQIVKAYGFEHNKSLRGPIPRCLRRGSLFCRMNHSIKKI